MGNENSTPVKIIPPKYGYRSNFRIWYLPNEIWFEILAFVKFHESPNLFLVNRDLLPICQEFFHSGNVGNNKSRNVRDLKIQLLEDKFTIQVERNGKYESTPITEIDPPKIFKSFGKIRVGNSCRIQAMKFLIKFESLLSSNNNMVLCKRDLLQQNDKKIGLFQQLFLQWQKNAPIIDERQFFFDWLEKKDITISLEGNNSSFGISRVLAEPLLAQFNGHFLMRFKNEGNLCEEDPKLIYQWISGNSPDENNKRWLEIHHFDANKALELACQIAMLFEMDHCDKIDAEKMRLFISIPNKGANVNAKMPNRLQKICNIHGDQLATLRTISIKGEYEASAYFFYTKPMENFYEEKEALEWSLLKKKQSIISCKQTMLQPNGINIGQLIQKLFLLPFMIFQKMFLLPFVIVQKMFLLPFVIFQKIFLWPFVNRQNNGNDISIIDECQLFLDLLEKKNIMLLQEANDSFIGICRVLAEPLMVQFNDHFCMEFENELNLCEEDSKLIYDWLTRNNSENINRWLDIRHFDVNKALELACQIATLFEKDHHDKVKAEKMLLTISIPEDANMQGEIPNQLRKICNIHGEQMATFCVITMTNNGKHVTWAFELYTQPFEEYLFRNREGEEFVDYHCIYFE